MLLFFNKSFNYFGLSWIIFFYKSKYMIPGELFASIYLYLISEERWNIMKFLPPQSRTRDPEQICCGIWTNVKMDCRILSKFQGRGIKIDGINSIRGAKSMFFLNIFCAIAPWVTSSTDVVFFALSLLLLPFDVPSLVTLSCRTWQRMAYIPAMKVLDLLCGGAGMG